ncbi:SufE family protein [Lutibaculum baratangense]|uniref:Sulfur acceptor protein SufE for iron-sulfur cluster assembly n=1 Tax=Lutibaculum baratangense AMV1 TaxID=631454 RepID=V4RBI0_9HYPH|nr:SufE family protein [Lutibaculum baratangense]ESR22764.1 Sulfur acceptor protein SufE for iron-sulfur cluster assembly [Lutibaculum baratangense AMV1]
MSTPPIEQIYDDFSFIDDWEERYRYVIELGRTLEPLPEEAHSAENKVQGCVSQVWLETNREDRPAGPLLTFRGDSDALIVRGLIAILFSLYSGRTPHEILETDAEDAFSRLGLKEHLTPQRSNGLAAMVQRVRRDAAAVAETVS